MSMNAKAPVAAVARSTKARAAPVRKVTTCLSDINLIIGGSNLAALSLGRFVFLPYQRSQVAKAGQPVQNGMTHAKAGDIRAEEAAGVLKTGDPSGFNLVDVMAWGSLGHAAGFAALALQSSDCLPCGFN
jgi:photosystem I subunit V